MSQDVPPTPSFDDVPPLPRGAEPPPEPEEDPFPEPTHPDYLLIIGFIEAGFDEIKQGADGTLDVNSAIGQYVDPQSIATIALQRAMGAFKVDDEKDAQVVFGIAMKISMLWTEAFIAGVKYGRASK